MRKIASKLPTGILVRCMLVTAMITRVTYYDYHSNVNALIGVPSVFCGSLTRESKYTLQSKISVETLRVRSREKSGENLSNPSLWIVVFVQQRPYSINKNYERFRSVVSLNNTSGQTIREVIHVEHSGNLYVLAQPSPVGQLN